MNNKVYPLVERITGAISLIFIGIVLLLNTTGVVPWSVWATFISIMIKLWPIFLIGFGLQIIFSSSRIMKSILNVCWTLFFLGVFSVAILASTNKVSLPGFLTDWNITIINKQQNEVQEEESIPISSLEVDSLDYNFEITTGEFNITTSKDSEDFIKLQSHYYQDHGNPKLSSENIGDKGVITFSQEFAKSFVGFFGTDLKYDSEINNNGIPTKINLKLTAGSLNANLSDMTLETLSLNMTAGNSDISIGENVRNLNLKTTAGSVSLYLPINAKIIINSKSTFGDITVDGQKLSDGTSIVNPDGSNEVTINSEQTAGSVAIIRN